MLKGVALAREHFMKARAIVAPQRALIEQIRTQRHDPEEAEELLVRFESTLRIFENDLDRLRGSK